MTVRSPVCRVRPCPNPPEWTVAPTTGLTNFVCGAHLEFLLSEKAETYTEFIVRKVDPS